jgi:hypothetical protein
MKNFNMNFIQKILLLLNHDRGMVIGRITTMESHLRSFLSSADNASSIS